MTKAFDLVEQENVALMARQLNLPGRTFPGNVPAGTVVFGPTAVRTKVTDNSLPSNSGALVSLFAGIISATDRSAATRSCTPTTSRAPQPPVSASTSRSRAPSPIAGTCST